MTLFLLIAISWIAVAGFFVALCRAAARSDAALAASPRPVGESAFLADVVLSREAPELAARDLRPRNASGSPVPAASAR